MSENVRHTKLEYFPLSMFKNEPKNFKDTTYDLRNHTGRVKDRVVRERDDLTLPDDSLIKFGQKTQPMALFCITMYNEPFEMLMQSIAGIYRAYYELCEIDENFVDRCHIVIIADGYDKLDEEFLFKWEKAGLFNEFKTKRWRSIEALPGSDKPKHVFRDLNFINSETMNDRVRYYGTNNILHTFSRYVKYPDFLNALNEEEYDKFDVNRYSIYNFLLGSSRKGSVKDRKYYHLPMPVHFGIKHRNQGKIESHKWFFKGFCEYMNPRYAQIIDCGSIALWNSISKIVMHMEAHQNVGGACGEIEVLIPEKKEDGSTLSFFESVIVRAQYLEYKISHYLDKATESLFGFVSVLPGAFSTFRWDAINGTPLDQFLKGANDEFGDMSQIRSCFEANKYLAEDRIMCLEIIAKKGKSHILHYVPGAKWLTDPPMRLTDLVKQRRRWFNGSMFASIYVLQHMCRIWQRNCCSCIRNLAFMVLYLYLIIQMIFSFIIVGIFFGVFSIFVRSIFESDDCLSLTKPANVIENVYLIFLFLTLLLSTTVEVQWAEAGFRLCSLFMGVFTCIMAACSVYFIVTESMGVSIAFIAFGVYLLSYLAPLVSNLRHLKFCDFMKGVVYATYLSPTYVNIFTIYAISNIHDVSWGNRPTNLSPVFQKVETTKALIYKNYRAKFLAFWCILNITVGYGFVYLWRENFAQILLYIGAFIILVMFFKVLLSIVHKMKSEWDRVKTKWIKFRRKSEVFKDADQMQDLQKEEVFGVYYEENGEDLRISRKTTKQQKKIMRSSVNDQFVYRGFSKREIGTIQRLSQGYQEDANLRKSTMRRSSGNYLNDSIILSEESSSDVSEPEFGSKEQSERVSKKGKRKFDQSEFNKVIKTPRVVFNPKDQSSTSKSSAKSENESEHDEDGSEPSEFPSSEDEGESESVETERKETLNSNSEMSSHI